MADQNKTGPTFGAPQFSRVARANVFENRRGKSCVAIQVATPLPSVGMVIESAIWARLVNTREGQEVVFEAALPRGLKPMRDGDDEAFLAHVERAAVAWSGYDAATMAAYATLTGVKPAPASGDKAVERSRLVFRPKPDAAPSATVAPSR